jgi:hypothetical protein
LVENYDGIVMDNVQPEPKSSATTLRDTTPSPLGRYVALIAWIIVLVTLLAIPFRILKGGFVPGGDARRHVGRAFTDKSFTEILVVRPEYTMDHSPGWEGLLHFLHQKAGWGRDALVSFSVAGLMLCIFYAPLPWLRRPEAWLAALLALMLAIPEVMTRFSQARPFMLTEGVLIAILFAWSKPGDNRPSWLKLALTTLGIALSVWMHGAWYLWALPLGAFFLARQWRAWFWLTCCVGLGVLAGASLTGRPVTFIMSALAMLAAVGKEHIYQWMLVGEFRPSYGEFDTLVLLALVLIWRRLQTKEVPDVLHEPVAWMILISWILGFKADRSWADWGVPATLVWLTMQFEELFPALWDAVAPTRLLACALIAAPLFLQATNDLDQRYSFNLRESFLDANDPGLKGWLPDDNGIFYSAQMEFFYNTFYQNPQAKWRYILGMEPALMPDADLKIFRNIQWNGYAFKAYEPWIDKMRAGDRLMISSPVQPNLTQLEWHNAVGNIWIGRLPQK